MLMPLSCCFLNWLSVWIFASGNEASAFVSFAVFAALTPPLTRRNEQRHRRAGRQIVARRVVGVDACAVVAARGRHLRPALLPRDVDHATDVARHARDADVVPEHTRLAGSHARDDLYTRNLVERVLGCHSGG